MVMLTITYNDSSNLAEQSRKATAATTGMSAHANRDVLIPGEGNQNRQLSQRFLHLVQICVLLSSGAARARTSMSNIPLYKQKHTGQLQ